MRHLLFASLALSLSSLSFADQVVPNVYAATAAPSSFLGPFTSSARTYQMLINSSELTSLVGQQLTGFAMRRTGVAGIWPASDVTVANYDVRLSESVAPADRSLTFANNVVGSQISVRSGPLTITASSWPAAIDVAFGETVTFQTPYLYSGGHLLVEIRQDGVPTGGSVNAHAASGGPGYGTLFSACWQSGYAAVGPGAQGNFAVTRFTSQAGSSLPISGTVTLNDFLGDVSTRQASMTLTNTGSTTALHTGTVTLSATGAYVFDVPASLPLGSYDLYADGSPFLKRKQTLVLAGTGATGINFALPNGDVDDSTEVDAADIDAVIAAFGNTGNVLGDVDGTLEVDAADIDVVIANFGGVDE